MIQLLLVLTVLAVIAVVGHGLWLGISWFIRCLARLGGSPSSPERLLCPRCSRILRSVDARCVCGWLWEYAKSATDSRADLQATARQLDRFRKAGVIEPATYDVMMQAVTGEEMRIKLGTGYLPRPGAAYADPIELQPESGVPAPIPGALGAGPAVVTPPLAGSSASGVAGALGTDRRETAAMSPPLPARAPARSPSSPATLVPAPPPAPTRPPRKPLSELMAAFMEAKNIRWGELVGGLLIVGCSIALVFSLWATITETPILKYFLFTGVTSAFFGVGLYTEHRWKLPTTSHGILIIGMLLVPLNFLAIAAFSRGMPALDLQALASELVAIAAFSYLAYRAGRVIVPDWAGAITLGVVGSSIAQIVIRRITGPDSTLALAATAGGMPLLCYAASVSQMLRGVRRWHEPGEPEANRVFMLLGSVTFSTLIAFGFLAHQSGRPVLLLRELAPLVSLAGIPSLASGLLLWRQLGKDRLASLRVAAMSIAVGGAGILLGGAVLAWPRPEIMLPVLFVDSLALVATAFLFVLPAAHLLAAPCLLLAYLVLLNLAWQRIGWGADQQQMARALLSGFSGNVLIGLVAIFGLVSEFLRRLGRQIDSVQYRIAAGAAAIVGLSLAIGFGFARVGDIHGVAASLAVYTAAALVAAWQVRRWQVTAAAAALLLLTIFQTAVYRYGNPAAAVDWQFALLLNATIAAIAAAFVRRFYSDRTKSVGIPASVSSLAATAAAIPFWLHAGTSESAGQFAFYTFWLSVIWFVLSYLHRRAGLFTAAHLALAISVVAAATSAVSRLDWFAALPQPWLDPRVLQVHGIALAMLSMAWIALRIAVRKYGVAGNSAAEYAESAVGRTGTVHWLLNPPWPPLDRLIDAALVIGLTGLAVYGSLPGILRELAPASEVVRTPWSLAGMAHEHAAGIGSWLLLAILAADLGVRFWEQFDRWLVYGLVWMLLPLSLLAASIWGAGVADASALRWISAATLVLGSVAIWLRGRLYERVIGLGWAGMPQHLSGLARDCRALLLTTLMTPVLLLTLVPSLAAISGTVPAGVPASTFFARLGDSLSYVVPLALVFGALVGHAIRDRSGPLAFGGGLILNLAVTLGYLLSVVQSGGKPSDALVMVRLMQINAIASGLFALAWFGSRPWLLRVFTGLAASRPTLLHTIQVAVPCCILIAVLIPGDIQLFLNPMAISAALVERGSVWGWLALLCTLAACTAWLRSRERELGAGWMGMCLLLAGSVLSFTATRWDSGYVSAPGAILGLGQNYAWLSYHTLLASRVVGAWLLLYGAWYREQAMELRSVAERSGGEWVGRLPYARWAVGFVSLAVLLSLRNAVDFRDPLRPWWPAGALASSSVLMAVLGCWTLHRSFLYWAGLLLNLSVTSWCMVKVVPFDVLDTVYVNVAALALPALAWLALELRIFRQSEPTADRLPYPAFHHVAAVVSLAMLGYLTAITLFAESGRVGAGPNVAYLWTAVSAVAAIVVATLWDSRARYALPALYCFGLVVAGILLDQLSVQSHLLGWIGVIVLAAYSIATSYMWSQREKWRWVADRLHMPRGSESAYSGQTWLLTFNLAISAVVVVLAYWIVLTFDGRLLGVDPALALTFRVLAGKAAMAQAIAVGLLAQGRRRTHLQAVALWLVAIGAVSWGWSWLDPQTVGNGLNRSVIVMVVLGGTGALVGLGLSKLLRRENEWTLAGQRIMPWFAGLAAASLATVLAIEVADQWLTGRVEMAGPAILAVAMTLIGCAATAIALAVVPGRDPFQLSERGRTAYVYAAEMLLGLLFMHIRLTKSEWFHGFFEQFWPIIVLALAYLGVGLSEYFQRRRQTVLSEPLQRTGALLPVLPVLGYWAMPSQIHFSLILVAAGLLYGALSVTRKSFGFGVLASLAANGGLVYLLNHDMGYGLFEHAQLWLIPGALCVLLAAYLNRDQLSAEQLVAIRYATVMVIYVSSSSDIFLTGVRSAPWLPLVLSLLSVAGIFAGILLRVRAFLFLGSSFLGISLVTMILSAHLNLGWTWLWWVAGISLGVAIIAIFALFEKKRTEMLQVVDGMRRWDA